MTQTEQDDSATRIEMALRGAKIAKEALAFVSLSPGLARLQFMELVSHIKDMDDFLTKKGFLK